MLRVALIQGKDCLARLLQELQGGRSTSHPCLRSPVTTSMRCLQSSAPARVLYSLVRSPHSSSRQLSARHTPADALSKAGWETIIGLEIHAQLKTREKLFSGGVVAIPGLACSVCSCDAGGYRRADVVGGAGEYQCRPARCGVSRDVARGWLGAELVEAVSAETSLNTLRD